MRTIYLDSEFICHVENGEGLTPYQTDEFDGKCKTYIEGYRLVPDGETWTRSDGEIFAGFMVAPATDYTALEKAQQQYEEDLSQMADMQSALEILGVEP